MSTPEDQSGAEPRPGMDAQPDADATWPPPPTAPNPWAYPGAATTVPPMPPTPPAYPTAPTTPPVPPTPPLPPTWGASADDLTPAPTPEPRRSPARGLTAIVAIIALVLASAGIGAATATAFNHRSRSFSSAVGSSSNTQNNGNNNSNGSGSSSNTSGLNVDAIAAKVTPSVVNIFTTIGDNQGEAAGTGIVISSDGKVLTNNHVIENSSQIRVQIGGKGSMHDATVVGYDKGDDVALVQIKGVSGLDAADRGNVSNVHAGDPIVAIGNAQGRGGTPEVVSGEVAALDQSVTAGDGRGESETLHGMIQVHAAIRAGDSGGPLINSSGQVIGMNTAASVGAFAMQSSDNVAFAIPINKAISVVNQIEAGDETDGVHIGPRGLLGVQVDSNSSTGGFPFGNNGSNSNSSGAVVADVQSGSPADDAGIKSGDTIVSVDGKSVSSGGDLVDALADSHPHDKVKITWQDDSGNQHSATVRLTSGPPA